MCVIADFPENKKWKNQASQYEEKWKSLFRPFEESNQVIFLEGGVYKYTHHTPEMQLQATCESFLIMSNRKFISKTSPAWCLPHAQGWVINSNFGYNFNVMLKKTINLLAFLILNCMFLIYPSPLFPSTSFFSHLYPTDKIPKSQNIMVKYNQEAWFPHT